MQESRPSQPAGRELPPLPDWPPLPEEKPTDAWPSLGGWPPSRVDPPVSATPASTSGAGPSLDDDGTWPPVARATGLPNRPGAPLPWRDLPPRSRLALGLGLGAALLLIAVVALGYAGLAHPGGAPPARSGTATGAHATNPAGSASATPLSTVTPAVTSTPAPTTPPLPLALAFTCASGQVRGTGKVCVHTQPGASLSISVRYCDGNMAKGLHGSFTADANGNFTWTWPIRSACVGAATATVTAKWMGQTTTSTDTFTVTGNGGGGSGMLSPWARPAAFATA